jgi:hypothetical protein
MDKFRNYVYLTICETSLELYRKTNFSTYSGYCSGMDQLLKANTLGKRDLKHLITICDVLEKVYSFSTKLATEYIMDYFASGRCTDFERVVRLTKERFPITGC